MQVKNECDIAHEQEGDYKSVDDHTDSKEREYETERDVGGSGDSDGTSECMFEVHCSSAESGENTANVKESEVRGLQRPYDVRKQVRYGQHLQVLIGSREEALTTAARGMKVTATDPASTPKGWNGQDGNCNVAPTVSMSEMAGSHQSGSAPKVEADPHQSWSAPKVVALEGSIPGACGAANIVDGARQGAGKLGNSKLPAGSTKQGEAKPSGPVHEACASSVRLAKEGGPDQGLARTNRGVSAHCAIRATSAGTIPSTSETAFPAQTPQAAVTTAYMGRLRLWVQSGAQGHSSNDSDLNPQGIAGSHHFPGCHHSPTHSTPHCASEPAISPEPWNQFQGHFYDPEVHLDVDEDTED